jgi:hypothetical protein
MIDTEKYEGHMREYNLEIRAWGDDTNANDKERAAIHALLNDAPLLLAEVKRLRSIADDLYAYIVSDADISLKIIEEQMDWRDEE